MQKSANIHEMKHKIFVFSIWALVIIANICATNIYKLKAEPFEPTSDTTILARLTISGDQSLRLLRDRWKAHPGNENVAVALAQNYLRLERAEGDPRYLGYAQAVLKPWWGDRKASTQIAITKAQLLARRHKFDQALWVLKGILSSKPSYPQALLSRAFILQSQGKIREAYAACLKLYRLVVSLASETCLARMESLGGKSGQADGRLTRALKHYSSESESVRLWALTNMAEIAWRRGDTGRAESLFHEALSLNRRDAYLLDAYADLLLEENRPAEILSLLSKDARADGHLLRLALAATALDDGSAYRHIQTLASRFADNRRRGEGLHLREEARFELSLRQRPVKALELARENWRTQREPADARLVLEAALAARQPGKAQPVLDWLRQTGLEDSALTELVGKFEEAMG